MTAADYRMAALAVRLLAVRYHDLHIEWRRDARLAGRLLACADTAREAERRGRP